MKIRLVFPTVFLRLPLMAKNATWSLLLYRFYNLGTIELQVWDVETVKFDDLVHLVTLPASSSVYSVRCQLRWCCIRRLSSWFGHLSIRVESHFQDRYIKCNINLHSLGSFDADALLPGRCRPASATLHQIRSICPWAVSHSASAAVIYRSYD